MQGSHTSTSADDTVAESGGLRLISTAERDLPDQLVGVIDGHLATFAAHVREGLLAASAAVGLEVMAELMQAEVTSLAGPKGRHNADRTATRHGTEPGAVTLGGRRVPVRRPRVRTVGDDATEVTLESYTTFADTDLLTDGIVARMLAASPPAATPSRSSRSVSRSSRPRPRRRGRRCRAGSLPPPPNGLPSCAPAPWISSAGPS